MILRVLFISILMFISSLYAQIQLADGVAAVVEDDPILYSEVNSLMQYYLLQNRINPAYLTREKVAKMQSDILAQLIDSKVVAFEAKKESIQVNSDRISKEVDRQIDGIIDNMGNKEDFIKGLKKEGMDIVSFRNKKFKQVKDQFYQMALKQKLMQTQNINRNKVVEFYKAFKDSFPSQEESYNLAVYLTDLIPPKQKDSLMRLKLTNIRKEILSGKISFEDAAKKYSEGPSNKKGGDLGFFGKGSMVKSFEKAAFSLNIGEISGIVKTQFGYHLIKVVDRDGNKVRARHILLQFNFNDSEYTLIKNDVKKYLATVKVDSAKNIKIKYNEALKLAWYQKSMLSPVIRKYLKNIKSHSPNTFLDPIIEGNKIIVIYYGGYKKSRSISLKDDYSIIEQKAKEYELNKLFAKKIKEWKKHFYIKVNMKNYKE